MTEPKSHLTTHEAATRLGVSVRRARALAASGRIPGATKVGRDWIIPASVAITPGTRGPCLRAQAKPRVIVARAARGQKAKRARQAKFRASASGSRYLARVAVVFNLRPDALVLDEPDLVGDDLS